MRVHLKTKYIDEQDAQLVFGVYPNGQVALLIKSKNGESLCKPTVSVDTQLVAIALDINNERNKTNLSINDVITLKDYSENIDIEDCLLKEGIISHRIADILVVQAGDFVTVPLCELSETAKAFRRQVLH